MREIGSEYWNVYNKKRNDKKFFLAGRTALEYIVRDMCENKMITEILMPSYCCRSMLEPFIRNNILVIFYDVFVNSEGVLQAKIPNIKENQAFYYIKYFGFNTLEGVEIKKIRKQCKCVIEDRTHSWMSLINQEQLDSDYIYISYRKWIGVSGFASAIKINGQFTCERNKIRTNYDYVKIRNEAMSYKKRYIEGDFVDKDKFLLMFNEAEEILEKDYVDYWPDYNAYEIIQNADWEKIAEQRRANAKTLINGLKSCKNLKLIFNQISSEEVPMFVPILVDNKHRNDFRVKLVKAGIYCPCHWPLSEYHKDISELAESIYTQEISLICDQRYSKEDMDRIISLIKEER